MSGIGTKQVSLHGRRAYITPDDNLVAKNAVVTGGEDKPCVVVPGSHDTVALFDDFLGDLVGDEWAFVESDTGFSGVNTTMVGGVFRISGSETNGTTSEAAGALTQGLFKNWKANSGGPKNGRLRMSARVKIGTVSTSAEGGRPHVFVGFSDTGGAEFPAYDTGAGVISPAADMVGFLYGGSAVANYWLPVAVKSTAGDSGDQSATVASADQETPVSNVYDTLEVEVRSGISDTGGTAHFWVNGKKVGTISSPIGSAIALTPWIGQWCQDTGFTNTLDIDYVAVSAPRDTGE
jgi:hypothetical protein